MNLRRTSAIALALPLVIAATSSTATADAATARAQTVSVTIADPGGDQQVNRQVRESLSVPDASVDIRSSKISIIGRGEDRSLRIVTKTKDVITSPAQQRVRVTLKRHWPTAEDTYFYDFEATAAQSSSSLIGYSYRDCGAPVCNLTTDSAVGTVKFDPRANTITHTFPFKEIKGLVGTTVAVSVQTSIGKFRASRSHDGTRSAAITLR